MSINYYQDRNGNDKDTDTDTDDDKKIKNLRRIYVWSESY